jgi:hypothetical protein
MIPSVIEPATFRLVVHCLNQPRKTVPCVLIDHHKYGIFVAMYVELQVMEVCSNHPFYGYGCLTFRIRNVTDDRSTCKLCTIMFYC